MAKTQPAEVERLPYVFVGAEGGEIGGELATTAGAGTLRFGTAMMIPKDQLGLVMHERGIHAIPADRFEAVTGPHSSGGQFTREQVAAAQAELRKIRKGA